jgi:hypothetical protein
MPDNDVMLRVVEPLNADNSITQVFKIRRV